MKIEITKQEYERLLKTPADVPPGFEVSAECSYFVTKKKGRKATTKRSPNGLLAMAPKWEKVTLSVTLRKVAEACEVSLSSLNAKQCASVTLSQIVSDLLGEPKSNVSKYISLLVQKGAMREVRQ